MPESATPTTELCRHTNEAIFIRNSNLCDDLIGKISFTEMIFYNLMGQRASSAQTAVLNAVLVTLMEHGLTPSAVAARMTALSSPEALQGAVVEAELLSRAGFDTWNWSDKALLRAITWEYNVNNFPAKGDDTWEIFIINHAYGTNFPTSAANTGKNLDFTDWIYGR